MTLLIDFPEILDVLQESGQIIELCLEIDLSHRDASLGIPSQKQLICRQLKAYIPDMGGQQITTQDVNILTGAHTVWVCGSDLTKEELKSNSLIKWNGKLYSLTYAEPPIIHRGVVMMHRLDIKERQGHQSISDQQPDQVINIVL
jgi:hypothetical protein